MRNECRGSNGNWWHVIVGIICVTFTKHMTSTIATCFMDRVVDKYYLAVVHGHITRCPSAPIDHSNTIEPTITYVPLGHSTNDNETQCDGKATGQPQTQDHIHNIQSSTHSFTIQAPIAQDPTDPTGFRCCIGGATNPGQVYCCVWRKMWLWRNVILCVV